MKFESHITFHINNKKVVEAIAKITEWKFSEIYGDALLEQKPYCYLTAYEPDVTDLVERMQQVKQLAGDLSIPVIRAKVERILYDTKTNLDELADFIPFNRLKASGYED